MEKREVFIDQAESRLKEWHAEVNLLNAKAERASADVKADVYKRVENIKDMKQRLETRLEEVKRDTKREWEDLKIGVERAQHDLRTAIDDLASLFSGEKSQPK
ncbi:hypothetical protein GF377_01675 [candidate division GN15 bacterium]|nr:hypothetical protein [candidate division GN15 bacterium]